MNTQIMYPVTCNHCSEKFHRAADIDNHLCKMPKHIKRTYIPRVRELLTISSYLTNLEGLRIAITE